MNKSKCLTLTIKKGKNLDSIFLNIPHNAKLKLLNSNSLNIYMLNIDNNKFSYKSLFDILKSNLGTYALSRREYEKDKERAISKAIDKFREIKDNNDNGAGGELGELLLYIFLENYLKAPKLLSKVELKTTTNQYVFNSDGVHFLTFVKDGYTYNQIIMGESKLKNNYSEAIDESFKSIYNSKLNDENDLSLICSEIFKESFDLSQCKAIEDMIVPNITNDIKNKTIKNTAFGIFIGSDYKIDDTIPIKEQIEKTQEDLSKLSNELVERINENIMKYKLSGYSFYIYYLPFNNICNDKKEIMKQLLQYNTFKEI